MCQLLGVSSNNFVDINLSLEEFQLRGRSNYHGYGFAFYDENNTLKIIKSPTSLADADITDNKFKFKSKIIIGHVRLASCGSQAHKNTHPFDRKNWSFAHNGTVRKIKSWALENFKPEGDTDSEHAFCYLLDKIAGKEKLQDIYKILKLEAEKISKLGRFNFLMSDGNYLFAFGHDALYFVKRQAPFPKVTLKDKGYSLSLEEIKKPDEKAVIIATEPLTIGEEWIEIKGLKVFSNGEEITLENV